MKKIIPIALSFILLFLVFRNVNLKELFCAIFKININAILLSFIFTLLSLYFRMKRWKGLLVSLRKEVKSLSVFSSLVIGIFGNHILPMRGGEFIGAYLLARKENISKMSAFGTVIMERVLDIFVILLITGVAIHIVGLHNQLVRRIEQVGLIILLSVILAIFVFLKSKTLFKNIFSIIIPNSFKKKLIQLIDSLSLGLSTIKNPIHFSLVLFWTLLFWFSVICAFIPLLYAFNFGAKIPVYTVFVLLLFVTFGMAIPAAPAGIGIYEYTSFLAIRTCLSSGAAYSSANLTEIGAFSIVSHFVLIFPEILLGYIFFLEEDLTWHLFYGKNKIRKEDLRKSQIDVDTEKLL